MGNEPMLLFKEGTFFDNMSVFKRRNSDSTKHEISIWKWCDEYNDHR